MEAGPPFLSVVVVAAASERIDSLSNRAPVKTGRVMGGEGGGVTFWTRLF